MLIPSLTLLVAWLCTSPQPAGGCCYAAAGMTATSMVWVGRVCVCDCVCMFNTSSIVSASMLPVLLYVAAITGCCAVPAHCAGSRTVATTRSLPDRVQLCVTSCTKQVPAVCLPADRYYPAAKTGNHCLVCPGLTRTGTILMSEVSVIDGINTPRNPPKNSQVSDLLIFSLLPQEWPCSCS